MAARAVLLIMVFITAIAFVSPAFAVEQNGVMEMPYTENPPTIDGKWTTPEEWADAYETPVNYNGQQSYILTKHDRDYLYIMVDSVSQLVQRSDSVNMIWLYFDTNNDGNRIRAADDFGFSYYSGLQSQVLAWQGSDAGWVLIKNLPSGSKADSSWSSANDPYEGGRDHLIFEFQIPLSFLHKADRYGFAISTSWQINRGEDGEYIAMWPQNMDQSNPSTFGTIVSAEGTVTAPPVPFMSVSTKSISFGEKEVSEKVSRSVTISNTGTGVLKITNIRAPAEFSVSGIDLPADVEPGGSASFEAVFAPLTLGEKSGKLMIQSNDLSNPSLSISVEGEGVEKGSSPIPTGSGCLVATASFGSELAPQVQLLRELRDNTVLGTQSGASFMSAFNSLYYSFSPTVADWERQSPVFREAVKVTITPMLSTLSILNHVEIDSEQEMLGYGIGIILLNVGMYFVAPAIVISRLVRRRG